MRVPAKKRHSFDGIRLCVDCRQCGGRSDISSRECVACVSEAVAAEGDAERIVLKGHMETEYHGEAAEILNLLGGLQRTARTVMDGGPPSKGCRGCALTPSSLISGAWATFPLCDMEGARAALNSSDPPDTVCEDCIISSYNTLDRLEHALRNVERRAARHAFGLQEAF